ncbi:MAG: M14 family metallopeptidase [Alphaproteobacteria bacterium]|nr:M14 family metallopeptidase [Alphaproteobacteria bacterium]
MSDSDFFASDYDDARQKFVAAVAEAGAVLERYDNPAAGPTGLDLSTDVAWLGPRDASKVLVTVSGTHGAEGFCGGGVQVGWFRSGKAALLPSDTALLQVHAINPYGFAWLRRTTEENVDVNRNYVDFDQPLPANDGYLKYRDLICPSNWTDAVARETKAEIERLVAALPPMVMQAAISAGQYVDPQGLFYGGARPSWSRLTMERIFERFLGVARVICLIDYHTGLGPRGYGERICAGGPGDVDWEFSKTIWPDITSTDDGSSSSAPLTGTNLPALRMLASQAQFAGIALEYGTLPLGDVLQALRADNWLHAHGDLNSAQGKKIKAHARDAFYQDADDWKHMVWDRAVETQDAALAFLADL